MADASDTSTETTETTQTDLIDSMSDTIGGNLFPEEPAKESAESEVAPSTGPVADQQATVQPAVTTPTVRQAPKTWPKEMHDHWGKLDPAVHDYLEKREKQMLDGLTGYKDAAEYGKGIHTALQPYDADFKHNNVDHATGIKFLLDANRQLTTGSPESRRAAYEALGKRLGLSGAGGEQTPAAPSTDPTVQRLMADMHEIKSSQEQQRQRIQQETKTKITQEVDAFAADTKAHPYFDECADHIVRLIQAGYPLQEAYDTAVMANPVSKQKEIARIQTEHEAKLKENARLQSLPKNKARGVNVQSQDTRRGGPTDPLGSMEETIKETLAAQRARAS